MSKVILDDELRKLDLEEEFFRYLNVETNKTKDFKNLLNNFKVERNVLIVVSELNDNLVLATRNLNNVLLLEASEINVLDIVSANLVIVEESAIKEIEEALV